MTGSAPAAAFFTEMTVPAGADGRIPRRACCTLAGVLLLLLALLAAHAAACDPLPAPGTASPLPLNTSDFAGIAEVKINGDRVAWEGLSPSESIVFLFNLTTGRQERISPGKRDAFGDLYHETVAITGSDLAGYRRVLLYSIPAGELTVLGIPGSKGKFQSNPALSDEYVVYEEYDSVTNDTEIMLYERATGRVKNISNHPADQRSPAIAGDIVVWEDLRSGNGDIYLYTISRGGTVPVCADPSPQREPAVGNRTVVWTDLRAGAGDIYLRDLETGTNRAIATGPAPQVRPAVSGDLVVWEDQGNGSGDIRLYDHGTGREWIVSDHPSAQAGPSIDESSIVWADARYGTMNETLFLFTLDPAFFRESG